MRPAPRTLTLRWRNRCASRSQSPHSLSPSPSARRRSRPPLPRWRATPPPAPISLRRQSPPRSPPRWIARPTPAAISTATPAAAGSTRSSCPPDETAWVRSFSVIHERNRELLRALVEDAAANPVGDPDRQRVGDFFGACMDESAIERAGLGPLAPWFAKIDVAADPAALFALAGEIHTASAAPFFTLEVFADLKDPKTEVAHFSQGGLGLPERDYYLSEADDKKELRAKYERHVARLLELAGAPAEAAATRRHRDPRLRDRARPRLAHDRADAQGRGPAPPAGRVRARPARAAPALGELLPQPRARRPRGRQRPDPRVLRDARARGGRGDGRDAARLPALSAAHRDRQPAARSDLRAALRLLRPHPRRPAGAAAALEAVHLGDRGGDGRVDRQALRGARLHRPIRRRSRPG